MIVVIDETLELLKKHCPLPKPARIVGIPRKRSLGSAYDCKINFIIGIATDVDSITQVDTLIHEWAHCLRGDGYHDDLYGIAWARCYRAVMFDGHNLITSKKHND